MIVSQAREMRRGQVCSEAKSFGQTRLAIDDRRPVDLQVVFPFSGQKAYKLMPLLSAEMVAIVHMGVIAMRIDYANHVADKAEGDCLGFPYNTELVSSEGVSILFWLGDHDRGDPCTGKRLEQALLEAIRNRRIVRASCCPGSPSGYWAHQDIIAEQQNPVGQ